MLGPRGIEITPFPRERRITGWPLPCATVFYNFPGEHFTTPLNASIVFLWEPPTVLPGLYNRDFLQRPFRVYTWDDDLVDNVRFFKFYYPSMQQMIQNLPPFSQRRLCTQVSADKESFHAKELYSSREEVIRFFESFPNGDFLFFGYGWEKKGYRNYGGVLDDKIQAIKNFKFSFCYENIQEIRGYVTEKIFDCFTAGCVPIYWGASNITDYIPANCFIDRRDFSSLDELYAFLQAMPEEKWQEYISNIRRFLKSDAARLFSWEHYLDIVADAVIQLSSYRVY